MKPSRDYEAEDPTPEKRLLGGFNNAMVHVQSKGMITSTEGGLKSKASVTNFASSLRDDDLQFSTSQVELMDRSGVRPQSGKPGRPPSNKGSTKLTKGSIPMFLDGSQATGEHALAIQEESSSLKTISPITENSQSKKSYQMQGPPTKAPLEEHSRN